MPSQPHRRRLPDPDFWRGKRVFLTGHTGFKGSWLTILLARLGAEVHGLALDPPTDPAMFDIAKVGTHLASDNRSDVRDRSEIGRVLRAAAPSIVLYLAAQPIVRRSYQEPLETLTTNIIGTANIIQAIRDVDATGTVRALVVVTSDKCYENVAEGGPFHETDRLGGHDPYSASKACAEIVTAAMRHSFFSAPDATRIATARAGNVIGGGDFAANRLVPDFVRARQRGEGLVIRNPGHRRPWQHVLEPLVGYLVLAESLAGAEGANFKRGWNFGPPIGSEKPVREVIAEAAREWPGADSLTPPDAEHYESPALRLDSSDASALLGWRPNWDLATMLGHTFDWYRSWLVRDDMERVTIRQIDAYLS